MDFFFETQLYDPKDIQSKMIWTHFLWFIRWIGNEKKLLLVPVIKNAKISRVGNEN